MVPARPLPAASMAAAKYNADHCYSANHDILSSDVFFVATITRRGLCRSPARVGNFHRTPPKFVALHLARQSPYASAPRDVTDATVWTDCEPIPGLAKDSNC